jgi:hypothetical protein
MTNQLASDYKIFQDGKDEYNVWKIDSSGAKVSKKNKEPYKTHELAVPYLKALYSVMPKAESSVEEQPEDMTSTHLILGAVAFQADEDNPRFLRFKDAVLARAETNKNRDNVDASGVQELADTISGTKIDLEHNAGKNVGVYTAGRVGENNELRVDGIIWLDACEALNIDPQDIIDGRYGLSIEATAETSECSICHSTHLSQETYCEHLLHKFKAGADRILRKLKAVGGALTRHPAGSGTGFGMATLLFVASHQEQVDDDVPMVDTNNVSQTASAMATTSYTTTNSADGITTISIPSVFSAIPKDIYDRLDALEAAISKQKETVMDVVYSAISKREDVTPADKKSAESEYGDVAYADEKNKKYPIDTLEHAHAAESYFGMPKNREKYSPEEQKAIQRKIDNALKKLGGHPSDKSKNGAKAMNEVEEKQTPADEATEPKTEEVTETPKEEKKEEVMADVMNSAVADMQKKMDDEMSKMKSALEAKDAELADLKAKLTASEQVIKAHRTAELKATLVGSVMDEEEFTGKVDELLELKADVIDLMVRNREAPKAKLAGIAATDEKPSAVKLF